MFCANCGTELPEGSKFCPQCGEVQEIEELETGEEPEKAGQSAGEEAKAQAETAGKDEMKPAAPIPGRQLKFCKQSKKLVFALAVIAAVIAAVVMFRPKSGGRMPALKKSEDMVYFESAAGGFLNLRGDLYEESGIQEVWYSLDQGTTIFLDDDILYQIKADMKPVMLAEDVRWLALSGTGEYAAYVTYDEELYLYNIKAKTAEKIDSDVNNGTLCLSPSGETVAYLKDYQGSDDNTLYIGGIGKNPAKVDKDGSYPIAVSDDGRNFFYVNMDGKLYFYDGTEKDKVASNVSNSNVLVNRTATEIVYCEDGRSYFYNSHEKESNKLSKELNKAETMAGILYNYIYTNDGVVNIAVANADSLKGGVYYSSSENSLYWLNTEGTAIERICKSSWYQVSADGTSVLYLARGKLYRVNKLNADMRAEVVYEEEPLLNFEASDDFSRIYVITEDKEIYYCQGKGKAEKISGDYDGNRLAYNEAGRNVFFQEDGDLYCADTKSESRKRAANDVIDVWEFANGVVYSAEEGRDIVLYYLTDQDAVELYSVESD